MTQKIAKEFLHKADPAQFLVLFNKATRLEVIMQQHGEAVVLQQDIISILEGFEDRVEAWKREKLQPAVDAWEQMKEARQLQETLRKVRLERVNCERMARQQQIGELKARQRESLSKKAKMEAKLARAEAAHAANMEGIPAVEEEVAAHRARQQKVIEECGRVERELTDAKKDVSQKQNERSKVEREIGGLREDVKQQKARARAQREQAACLRNKKHPERAVSRLPQLQDELDELDAQLQVAHEHSEQAEAADGALETKRDAAKRDEEVASAEVQRLQDELDSLQRAGSGDRLARFGPEALHPNH